MVRRPEQATGAGYRILSHFDIGQSALDAYYRPLEARVIELEGKMAGMRVMDDLRRELRAYHEGNGQFGYEMFVLELR